MNFSVNKRLSMATFISLCLILSLPVHASSSVWEIEKDGRTIFLGGTLHILSPDDYPLPLAFDSAYSQSAKIVFETDLTKLHSPQTKQLMMRQLTYSDGRNLQQVISNSTYLALEEFFTARGVPMANIVNFKAGMVAAIMTMVELNRLGINGVGVDAHFNQKAINEQKARGQLETVEEQLEFLSNMGVGNEDKLLAYNLTDLKKMSSLFQQLKSAWRNGDLAELSESFATPFKRDFPEIYHSLLTKRNNAWIPHIEAYFETKETELVLVGALHLAGEDGLLAMLSAKGYNIKQLP